MATDESIGDAPVRYLGDVSRVNAQPGDIFVLKCNGRLSDQEVERIQALWRDKICDGAPNPKLLILESGMQLDVIGLGEAREIVTRMAVDSEGGHHD